MARQKKLSITGLTPTQYGIICDIIGEVKDIMQWDDDLQAYTDNDGFIHTMSEEEYKELMNIKL